MNPRKWLMIASIVILVGGLASAVALYQSAAHESRPVLGYETGDDGAYPVRPGDSKSYLRDLELYGGKANVLATQLRLWLTGLMNLKSLAFLVGLVSILGSYALFSFAQRLGSHRGRGGHETPG